MSCSASSARPPLTIRARAALLPPPTPPSPPPSALPLTRPSLFPPMLASFLALFPSKSHPHIYSLPQSQSSSLDSLSLPLPASPQQASFRADVWQEHGHFRTGGRPSPRESVSSSSYSPIILVLIIFPLSTLLLIGALFSLPITASFPRNLSELSNLGHELQAYSDSGLRPMAHVLAVLSITALWKHAWSVPGSVLLNVLAGVLLSPVTSTLLMTSLTAFGSLFSTLLATPLAPFISQFFPKALTLTRTALEGGDYMSSREKSPTWVRLSILRLIGVVPWSGINIACGVTGVSFSDCLLGAFIGTLPWTAVTCQIGDIMQTVATASNSSGDPETLASLLHSPTVVFKLAFLTFVSLVPILTRDRLRGMLGRDPEEDNLHMDAKIAQDPKSQWQWWRLRSKPGAVMEMDVRTIGAAEKAAAPS